MMSCIPNGYGIDNTITYTSHNNFENPVKPLEPQNTRYASSNMSRQVIRRPSAFIFFLAFKYSSSSRGIYSKTTR